MDAGRHTPAKFRVFRPAILVAFIAIGLFVSQVAAAPARAAVDAGVIQGAGAPGAIPDSYIVVFKDSFMTGTDVSATANALAAVHGGRLGHVYTAALSGFSVTVGARQAARLAKHPAVAYVAQDQWLYPQGTQAPVPSWGIDRVDQRARPLTNSFTYANLAPDVTAYVIDSGINIHHPEFYNGRARYGWDFVGNDPIADDCLGHGTHVAGIIGGTTFGVAKQAKLVALKVLCGSGTAPVSAVVAAVNWVTSYAVRPAVANISLVGGSVIPALDTAIANSIAQGISYTIAAGNSNSSACNFTPARVPTAITVAATTNTDSRASFSNYGPCVDLLAPGQSITSAWIPSSATATISGTSTSAPHAAGAAALYLQVNPNATPQQVRDALVTNATPNVIAPPPGTGTPNLLLYTDFLPR